MSTSEKLSGKKPFSPIRVRYILPFTILVGLIFYILIWVSLNDQENFIESELESKGKALSAHIEGTVLLDLLLEDSVALVNRIAELKSIEPDFKSLAFYNAEKQLVVGEGENNVFNPIEFKKSAQYVDEDQSISIYKELANNLNEPIGSFVLSLSKKHGQVIIRNSIVKLTLVTVILLAFVTALLWIISRRINTLTTNFINEREETSLKLRKQTERLNKALRQEKHLGEMKTHFVSVASHQFRTPLAIIQTNSDILKIIAPKVQPNLKDKMDKSTARITAEIDRMTELMDDVLILGKVSSGKMSINKSNMNLNELCSDISEQFNEINQNGRRLEYSVKTTDTMIIADQKMLRHAITNLVSNAFKYSNGSNPKLILDQDQDIISIVIEDQGIGIPQKDLNQLFQPFYRASNVVEFSGSGLGLSIVKSYIELNKGTISVETEENKGSRFEIRFKRLPK